IDYAVIEAAAITDEGLIIPTGSVGNSPIYVQKADNVIIELNLTAPKEYEGLHDIYIPKDQGEDRGEIPVHNLHDRIGDIGIKVDPNKVRIYLNSNITDTIM